MGMIELQFCAFDSMIGEVITWGTQGQVDHVDIVLRDGRLLGAQNEDGLGGMPSGVQIRPADYGDSCGMKTRMRVKLPTTMECEEAAYEWARSMIGTPYDTKAIAGIALNEDWSQPGHMICSGFATGMLCQPTPSFLGRCLAKHWRIVTPEELLLVCSAFSPVINL